ncbi:hypothetical protein DICVIV_07984 [Dictyocaulus viviparus]|uniref:Uncharacterized protein n=1 Tax=Dictyocaulus viviparus TaxID=29172 RepID=A0A0D8XUB7_DICVI|nr:hypothetical protein DICVIV_07984 [Dictyocaulus viviparus]
MLTQLFLILLFIQAFQTRVITFSKRNMNEYADELITPAPVHGKEETGIGYNVPEEQPSATVAQESVPESKVEASGYR